MSDSSGGGLTEGLIIGEAAKSVTLIMYSGSYAGIRVPFGRRFKSSKNKGAGIECLNKNSSTCFSGIRVFDSMRSLGIRKVVFALTLSCTMLIKVTKVK
ncbi:hypothetical protein ACMD2_18145 [Ananas comosus]|uniref:Uncharacterized protein n=1 Tax=Ananas comosus TaxID=4615 RepID=A0A199VED2_ANACO|nr:hypothetical protein ACMD2_18145 [Ananas comosus]